MLHELAHYLTALFFGASAVSFHGAYVNHDPSSVSGVGNALIALFGPLSSYLMILVCWRHVRKTPSAFALALGFVAAIRNLAMLPYTVRTILGRDISTFFFDEIRGATAIGVSPLYFVALSLMVGAAGALYFSWKAKREKGVVLQVTMIVGAFGGVALWSVLGPMLLPGGHGFISCGPANTPSCASSQPGRP